MARPDAAGVVLAGAPGVGKTRLAVECLRLGERVGFVTAMAGATRAAASIPFGAVAPLVPSAHIVGDRRMDVLQQIRDALLARAGDRPLLVAIDDAHLLDDASAALFHQLAGTGSAFIVATLRSGEPAPDPVVALWKDGLAERIDLHPLVEEQIGQVLAAVLGGPADGGTVRKLFQRTRGNVLFLRELVLGGLEAGSLRDDRGVWRLVGDVPPSARLREIIEARLAGLGQAERRALEIVALGEPIAASLLQRLVPPAAMEAVERKGLLEIRLDGRRSEARLGHPLYGEVLRAHLPETAARSIRRALADVVETAGARRGEDPLRVAVWRLEGGGSIRPDLVLTAARRARLAFDLPLAGRLARLALEAGGGARAARLLGEILSLEGRYADAESLLASVPLDAEDPGERALVAMGRSFNLFWGAGRREEAEDVASEAEAAVSGTPYRDEVAAERAAYALFSGAPTEALAIALPILDDPGSTPRARARAAFAAVPALAVMGRTAEAVALADAGLAAARDIGKGLAAAFFEVLLLACRALALSEAGELAEAEAAAEEGYERALASYSSGSQAVSAWSVGRAALLRGRVATAARWFREGAAIDGELGLQGRQQWSLADLALAAAWAADVPGAEAALADLDSVPVTPDRFLVTERERARAWTDAARGDVRVATERLEGAATAAAETGQTAMEAAALHDLARLGEGARAASGMADLVGDGRLMDARRAHCSAAATDDPVGLEDAADRFERLGALLFAAEAAAAAAAAHRRRGDGRRATAAERRSRELAARCEGARTPALALGAGVASLTAREREIAELAAAGVSSRDIAGRLFLSVRTVDNHLQQAYRKLGVMARGELAAALAGPGGREEPPGSRSP